MATQLVLQMRSIKVADMAHDKSISQCREENRGSTTPLVEHANLTSSFMGLTELPESVGQAHRFTGTGDLSNNALTTLPECLGRLGQLRALNLFANRLMILPESLGQLTELRSLNLFGNRLETLPDSLGRLRQSAVFGAL